MRRIACNHAGGKFIPKGSLAFVAWTNPGSDNDRIPVDVRTRGGRWVRKWTRIELLDNFRLKTVHESHPAFHMGGVDLEGMEDVAANLIGDLRESKERHETKRGT